MAADQQTLRQSLENKSPIEPIGNSGQITVGILAKIKGMISTVEAGFDVAQHSVYPIKFRQLVGFSASSND